MIPKKLLIDIKEKEKEFKSQYPDKEIEYKIQGNERENSIFEIYDNLDELVNNFPVGYGLNRKYKGLSMRVSIHLIEEIGEEIIHLKMITWELNK